MSKKQFNFVTAETSNFSKKPSFKFPKLKQGEKTVITFLTQLKDFGNSESLETPWLEVVYYYDDTSKSNFRFASDVSDSIKNRILSKPSVKEFKRTLATILQYTLEPNNKWKVNGINQVYFIILPQEKSKKIKDLGEALKEDGVSDTIYGVDFRIECVEENFAKWEILSSKAKAFNSLDESVRHDLTKQALDLWETKIDYVIGKELDEDSLIEKFALDAENYSTKKINPMDGGDDDDDNFSDIAVSKSFGSK